ncbi:hypothetical protein BH11PSE11_BH11PSE11_10390 [soil metagenome]
MKKKILALAVLGAFASVAQAQTNVTIGGVLQVDVKSYKVGNTTRPSTNELRVDDDYTSRFWLTGTEDLGGGNSAIFYVENRLNMDVNNIQGIGNGLANGDSFVGLKGGWGQVTVGKHSWMVAQGVLTEALAAKGVTAMPSSMWGTFSILSQAAGYLDVTRRANSIMYRSPNMSGFSGSAGFSPNSAGNEGNLACTGTGLTALVNSTVTATSSATCPTLTTVGGVTNTAYTDGREYYLQGNYSNGPLWLNMAYRNNQAEGRNGIDDKQLRLSGYYKINSFKLGLQVDRATRDVVAAGNSVASFSRTAWQIPLSYVMGNEAFLLSYTRANDLSNTPNSGAKMWSIGWDHAFSARTNGGIYYSKLTNDSAGLYQSFLAGTSSHGTATGAGESASTFALGIKHTF